MTAIVRSIGRLDGAGAAAVPAVEGVLEVAEEARSGRDRIFAPSVGPTDAGALAAERLSRLRPEAGSPPAECE